VALASNVCLTELSAELLPTDRQANWQDAGTDNGIPSYNVGIDATDAAYGATGDGVTDDTTAIQQAIDACPAGSAVFLPDGIYLLTDTLTINKSIVLRGESMLGTVLKMNHSGHGIYIGTYANSSAELSLSANAPRGTTTLQLDSIDSNKFVVGRIVELKQDNDPNVYQVGYKGYESWTDRQTGMTNEITAINGTQVTLKHPLLKDYDLTYSPKLRAQSSVDNAGVETLKIDRILDDPDGTGINVYLYAAKQSWVKDIWSEKAYATHIRLARSLECEVRGCVVNDKWIDEGGEGYGILVQDRSTLNLIEDNTCSHVRHSLVVQTGATANVFAYNFSRDPNSSVCENCIFSDISAHGSMANYTLWEGNKGVQIYLDHVHGSNPWNTAFRNYATKPKSNYAGIQVAETSKWNSILGNVSGNMLSTGDAIVIDDAVDNVTIVTGNLNGNTGETYWDSNYDTTLPDSLYLTSKPSFLGSKAWPLHGPSIGVIETLPAEDRWYTLTNTTAEAEAPVATTPIGDLEASLAPVVYYDCSNDGNPNLTDLSGNSLNATINGATFTTSSHDDTDALSFDGSSSEVIIPDNAIIDFSTNLTLSAWVNLNTLSKDQCIFGKNTSYHLTIYKDGKIGVAFRIDGAWTLHKLSTETIPSNTWTHVATTYDGANMRIYINGIECGVFAQTGTINSSNKDLYLGTIWGGYYLDGQLDDITLFDTSLSPEEIQQLYTGAWLSPVESASVITYQFESGAGSTAIDSSGNQLDATLTATTFTSDAIKGNYALSFNGSSSVVQLDDHERLDMNDAISISAWVKTNDASKNQCILGRNTAYYLNLYGSSNGAQLRAGLCIAGSWSTKTSSSNAADKIKENEWTHVATTYDGSEIVFYVSGIAVSSSSLTGTIDSSNKSLELGSIWNGYRLDGTLDQVQLFDYALTAQQVFTLSM
jgi:NOL1/NOP2/fmu family ribosome biogenesis protein